MRVCVRAFWLRQIGYDNLREFLKKEKNVLVCRQGRIFITERSGIKRPFHYKQSPWANEFKVGPKHHTLEESLRLYDIWLDSLLQDKDVAADFAKLQQKNLIGCFCPPEQRCHVDVILRKLKKLA